VTKKGTTSLIHPSRSFGKEEENPAPKNVATEEGNCEQVERTRAHVVGKTAHLTGKRKKKNVSLLKPLLIREGKVRNLHRRKRGGRT